MTISAGLAHLVERGARAGIEIEVQVVGPVDVVAARVPLVQVDAAEVDDPQQRGQSWIIGKSMTLPEPWSIAQVSNPSAAAASAPAS